MCVHRVNWVKAVGRSCMCGPAVTCEYLQHLFCRESLFKSKKTKSFWHLIDVGLSANNCRTFLTKYRARAVSQQKEVCVSGNVYTFSVFGNKLPVGKTIRLKTSADIQLLKIVMPTLTKKDLVATVWRTGTL